MTSLLDQSDLTSEPIQPGDAGVIIRPDLSFSVFSTHKIEGEGLTEAQIEQGKTLLAIAVALKHPQVMSVLKTMAVDPAIVGDGISLDNLQ